VYRISTVAVAVLTFQCFYNFQNALLGFFSVISAIFEAIRTKRERSDRVSERVRRREGKGTTEKERDRDKCGPF
jgi:hypothetical protein